jgi:hypothetical protein
MKTDETHVQDRGAICIALSRAARRAWDRGMGQVLIVVFFRGTGTPVLPMLKMPASKGASDLAPECGHLRGWGASRSNAIL